MTGDEVSHLFPGSPDAMSASSDVYFVGYTTFLADMPGRLLHAEVNVHAKDCGNGAISVVRAGHFRNGSREFCVQIWNAKDALSGMMVDRPDHYSAADIAKYATKTELSVWVNKTFVK